MPDICVIDVDGLRPDVLERALRTERLPGLTTLFGQGGSRSVAIPDVASTAPSITFCAQASIVTGSHPQDHGIPGNDFFDRLGKLTGGVPRHYGLDGGEQLRLMDAVNVFRKDLADRLLSPDVETIFERAAKQGIESLVVHNIYTRGATVSERPAIIELARFTKGGKLFGYRRGGYDELMLRRLERGLKKLSAEKPALIFTYFMGLDSYAHHHGPDAQHRYLCEVLDRQLVKLVELVKARRPDEEPYFIMVSDHGQFRTAGCDDSSMRLGSLWDQEFSVVFRAAGRRLMNHVIQRPDRTDAVVGMNGGMAHVYLRRERSRPWSEAPSFERDVLPVAEVLWEMSHLGRFGEEFRDSLDAIFIRDSERGGWHAPYQVFDSTGVIQSVASWSVSQEELVAPASRLATLSSIASGDIVLLTKGSRGMYFGAEGHSGIHGGLAKDDSLAVLYVGLGTDGATLSKPIVAAVADRQQQEQRSQASIADLKTVLEELWRAAG